jgi:hypothetical protein
LEASWDSSKASKPLTTIMFAIYNIAISPMSPNDCQTIFWREQKRLISALQSATVQALIAADFVVTRELEVLQALVLFLFSDPEFELTRTLSGATIRIGPHLDLHRERNAGPPLVASTLPRHTKPHYLHSGDDAPAAIRIWRHTPWQRLLCLACGSRFIIHESELR